MLRCKSAGCLRERNLIRNRRRHIHRPVGRLRSKSPGGAPSSFSPFYSVPCLSSCLPLFSTSKPCLPNLPNENVHLSAAELPLLSFGATVGQSAQEECLRLVKTRRLSGTMPRARSPRTGVPSARRPGCCRR